MGLMGDDMYRKVILANIARNTWDGTFQSFHKVWNDIFYDEGINAVVVDNMDMTCTVTLSGNIESELAALITNGYIFPKPMGVLMNYAVSPQGDRTANVETYGVAAPACNFLRITVNAQ